MFLQDVYIALSVIFISGGWTSPQRAAAIMFYSIYGHYYSCQTAILSYCCGRSKQTSLLAKLFQLLNLKLPGRYIASSWINFGQLAKYLTISCIQSASTHKSVGPIISFMVPQWWKYIIPTSPTGSYKSKLSGWSDRRLLLVSPTQLCACRTGVEQEIQTLPGSLQNH